MGSIILKSIGIILGISMFGFFCAGCLQVDIAPHYYECDHTIELVALSNSTEIHGSWAFLGAGVINQRLCYTYMYRANGGFRMSSVPASRSTIHETNTGTPHIDVYVAYSSWTFPFGKVETNDPNYYHIYIPEGSIWQGYDVDVRRQ